MLGTITDETRIIDLTVGQLKSLLNIKDKDEYVYGLDGVCETLKVCKTKACYLNKSGLLDEAKIRGGRKPVFDKNKLKNIIIKS